MKGKIAGKEEGVVKVVVAVVGSKKKSRRVSMLRWGSYKKDDGEEDTVGRRGGYDDGVAVVGSMKAQKVNQDGIDEDGEAFGPYNDKKEWRKTTGR